MRQRNNKGRQQNNAQQEQQQDHNTNTNSTMSNQSVWVWLYYKGKERPAGQSVEIESIPKNVNDLKQELKPAIDHAAVNQIYVYPHGTTSFSEDEALESWKSIPDSSGLEPLIVVAPAPPPQQQQESGEEHFKSPSFVYC